MSPNASTSTFDFEPIQDLAIARANEFDVLDERIEWEKFSKSISDTDINPVWKSHIVIEGMHCAACAFQIEDVLKKFKEDLKDVDIILNTIKKEKEEKIKEQEEKERIEREKKMQWMKSKWMQDQLKYMPQEQPVNS